MQSAKDEAILRNLLQQEAAPRGAQGIDTSSQKITPRPPPPRGKTGVRPRGQKIHEIRQARLLREHQERLRKVQPLLDNTVPKTAKMNHLKPGRKHQQESFGQRLKIEHENQMLVQRMTAVMHRPSAYSKSEKVSLRGRHERQRMWEFRRIESENRKLAARLERVPPFMTNQQLKKEWKQTKKKMATICAYPLTIAQPYRPPSTTSSSKQTARGKIPLDAGNRPKSPTEQILPSNVRIFPPRSRDLPVGRALSPKLEDECDIGDLGFTERNSFKTGVKPDWTSPEPPGQSARPGRLAVFSEVISIPMADYHQGAYTTNICCILVAASMTIDEAYRTLEINVSRLRSGVASDRPEEQHQLVMNYSDVFTLVQGDTRSTYSLIAKKLWFRNNKLMLTAAFPSIILDALVADEEETPPVDEPLITDEDEEKVKKLQACIRGRQARQQRKEENEAAIKLQSRFRRYNTEKLVVARKEEESATKLQKRFRRYSAAKLESKMQEESAVKLQKAFRGFHQKRHSASSLNDEDAAKTVKQPSSNTITSEDESAVKLQSAFRGHAARRQRKSQELSASKLQSAFRGHQARRAQKEEAQSAVKLQSAFRGHTARRQQKEDKSATKLQSAFRGHQSRQPIATRALEFSDGNSFKVNLKRLTQDRYSLELWRHQLPQKESLEQHFIFTLQNKEEDADALMDYLCESVLRYRVGNLETVARFAAHADPSRLLIEEKQVKNVYHKLRKVSRYATMNRARRSVLFICEYIVEDMQNVKIQMVFNREDNSTRWYEFKSNS